MNASSRKWSSLLKMDGKIANISSYFFLIFYKIYIVTISTLVEIWIMGCLPWAQESVIGAAFGPRAAS